MGRTSRCLLPRPVTLYLLAVTAWWVAMFAIIALVPMMFR